MKVLRPHYSDFDPELKEIPAGFDIVELKYDGMWGKAEIDLSNLEIYSRQGNSKFSGEVDPDIPNMTILGEYLYASNWADQRGLKNHYFAFDLLRLGERDLRDLPLRDRKQLLSKVLFEYDFPEWVHEAKYFPISEWQTLWKESVIHEFFEGLVFKSLDGEFGSEWARMKRKFTVDYVYMGVSKSDKFERDAVKSILGGLYVKGELTQVCKVGGLSHAERYDFWDRQDDFIGKVFEAEGRGLFKSGALRHPNFVKWREDKRPDECILPGEKKALKSS